MSSEESQSGWWQSFYQELKDRRVIRVATLYVFLFWPVIQIADILSPALDIPAEAMRYLLAIFVLGLPIVLILSWLYDLNRSGVVRGNATTSDVQKAGANQALLGRRFERALIVRPLGSHAGLEGGAFGSSSPEYSPSMSDGGTKTNRSLSLFRWMRPRCTPVTIHG